MLSGVLLVAVLLAGAVAAGVVAFMLFRASGPRQPGESPDG